MLTTVDEIREHLGNKPDPLNLLIVTSASIHTDDGEEPAFLEHAETLQLEGFVLHPRKLRAEPFEIVTKDEVEANYLLEMIRESVGPQAMRQASGLSLAQNGTYGKLGAWLKIS